MKTLQEYIIESIENDQIDEGKVWDAIKSWFKNLFKGSTKKYDRWNDNFDGVANANFKTYIGENFNLSSVEIKLVPNNDVMDIVKPLGHTPTKENNDGFWKFVDDTPTLEQSKKIKYFSFMYNDKSTNDACALMKINTEPRGKVLNNYFEIINIQIREEYITKLTLDKVVKLIKNSSEIRKLGKSGMFIYKYTTEKNGYLEHDNTDVYNKLLNDCGFEKGTVNNKKYAYLNETT